MNDLLSELKLRFVEDQISLLNFNGSSFICIDLHDQHEQKILMTYGLSDYQMPVPAKLRGEEFNELYVLLPSYWDFTDKENNNMTWVFYWLQKLKEYVVQNNTWFGHGHTFPTNKNMDRISNQMKQNHFILVRPIDLSNQLAPLTVQTKTVHFLALVPIFADEMDYKQGKGTLKLLTKFAQKNISEKLDDFRSTVLKSRWNFFSK